MGCFTTDFLTCFLFQVNVLLKPEFDCLSSYVLSSVDKVTTGTKSFVSVMSNFTLPVELIITKVGNQFKIRIIPQLIRRISRILEKLLRYFNSTAVTIRRIFTCFF